MRVLLISANTELTNILPLPLGLNCVAVAVRNAGHEIKLVDLMTERNGGVSLQEEIRKYKPEVIGISVRNIDDQNMDSPKFLLPPVKKVVSDCRGATDAPLVLGGAGFSIFPESTLNYLDADMGIQGEGKGHFLSFLTGFKKESAFRGYPAFT